MGEAAELSLSITAQETEAAKPTEPEVSTVKKRYKWWLRIALYTLFVIAGQAVAIVLGRVYYDKGGKSKWMATVAQLAGFPILIPLYCVLSIKKLLSESINWKPPSALTLASIYVCLGLLIAGDCFLYAVGLLYLPVSTYSIICASQLAFNALFSFFLNSQKFTFLIVNSLVLLTISSILLVSQNDDDDDSDTSRVSREKYVVGFLCTIGASAGYGLVLSLTQLSFQKVLTGNKYAAVMNMMIYPTGVAVAAALVGLFASGEWKGIKHEMEGYQLGKESYVMNLAWTAVSWQVFAMGSMGLIFEASSLFSNAISVAGLPVIPVLAVIFLGDKMDGIEAISLVMAIWGFVSYVYQHYLDDPKSGSRTQLLQKLQRVPLIKSLWRGR